MSNALIAADTEVLNAEVFFKQLDRLEGASIGVIAIRTREMERAKELIQQWAALRSFDFHVWDRLKGFQRYLSLPVSGGEDGASPVVSVNPNEMDKYTSPHETLSNTEGLYDALAHYVTRADNKRTQTNNFCGVFMAVDNEELKDLNVQQFLRDHVHRAYTVMDRIIMVCPPTLRIPDEIQGDVELIDLSPPSFAELLETLKELEGSITDTFQEFDIDFEMDDDDYAKLVQNGMGMTNQEFENAVSLAIVDLGSTCRDAAKRGDQPSVTVDDFVNVIRKRKLEVLKQTQILELIDGIDIEKVGGLDLLKLDLAKQQRAFLPEAREYGIRQPKGFVAVGPSGTGKTLICRATSAMLGLPAIKFDMSAVYNSLVGASEERLRMCLRMLEDMQPCIAFIDEIDKALSSDGGNDGGVSSRILGTFLTWMQEKADRGSRVYVIASANDVSRIPPEVLRKGRFDTIWAVSFPSAKERAEIIKIHVELRGHKLTDEQYVKVAKATDTFVGSELESVVEQALLEDFYHDKPKLTFETVLAQAEAMIPQSKAFPKRIEQMAKWAKQNARPASSEANFGEEPEAEVAVRPGGDKTLPRVVRRKPAGGLKSANN